MVKCLLKILQKNQKRNPNGDNKQYKQLDMNLSKKYDKNKKIDENKTTDKINKNLRKKLGKDKIQKISKAKKQKYFQIATLKVRTLKSEEKLSELEQAFDEKKIAILGLIEVRRKNEKMIVLNSKTVLLHSRCKKEQRGTGFMVHRDWADKIKKFEGVSDRIAILQIQIKKK